MQHMPVEPYKPRETPKIIVASLSGLLLGLILVTFTFLAVFSFRLNFPIYFLYAFFLYLLAPILPSLYVAQQTGDAWEGHETGLLTVVTGTVLTLLVLGVFLWILNLGHSGASFISPVGIFFYAVGLGFFGFLVSIPGAIIGGKLGQAWQRFRITKRRYFDALNNNQNV